MLRSSICGCNACSASVCSAPGLEWNTLDHQQQQLSLRENRERSGCQRLQVDCISGAGAKKPSRASV